MEHEAESGFNAFLVWSFQIVNKTEQIELISESKKLLKNGEQIGHEESDAHEFPEQKPARGHHRRRPQGDPHPGG